MIDILETPAEARSRCAAIRADGRTIGFVPTMGALHEGHLSLVRRSVKENDFTAVSVFVNPLQFDDPADLKEYPRDFALDARLLEGAGASLVFTGTLAGFFPDELDGNGAFDPSYLEDPGLRARGLEGACRLGHFEGVATIVRRLFEIVHPTIAYFGQKDFQQSLVVRDLARRLGAPEIRVCPIYREDSGLALSSRNELLSVPDRQRATCLHKALGAADTAWRAGERDPSALALLLRESLDGGPMEVEYAEIRDPDRWQAVPHGSHALDRAVALLAARIGGVRLIDNRLLGEEALSPAAQPASAVAEA